MSKTILIVDDDILITATLSTLIEMTLDYHVITSNDPTEALQLEELHSKKIDMILSDFMMPVMNGLEFLKSAAAIHPEAVLILLTGYADKQNAIRCINELDLYHYLEKPWDNDALIKTIQNGLEKKALQGELSQKLIELEHSNNEINRLYSLLKSDYHQEINKNEELNRWNKELEKAVAERTASLKNLLDNAGEGFLTLDSDLTVHPQCSLECYHIFGKDITGEYFPQLIYPWDQEQKSFFGMVLSNILQKENDPKLDIYISLLPAEAIINSRYIEIKYKLLDNRAPGHKYFMVILTDITDKKELENKIEKDRNTLRMVVKAIMYYSELTDCLHDYYQFCSERLLHILDSSKSWEDMVYELFRQIHTFKGSFSQFDMSITAERLHQLENQLSELKAKAGSSTVSDIIQLFQSSAMDNWPEEDLQTLKSYLGEDFFNKRNLLYIDKSRLIEIEKKIISLLPPAESKLILPDIRQLRYKPFRELLKAYPEYLQKLADRLDKQLSDVEIQGGNMLVDVDKYNDFAKSLVHVFRNVMDHGLEDADVRAASGKDFCGSITCNIYSGTRTIVLSIADDGAGMDPSIIKEKAVQRNIITEAEAEMMNDVDALQLIFEDNFSTRESITELSGRGVGLSAVRRALEKLGGSCKVESTPGKGSHFTFVLPYEELGTLQEISIDRILNPIVETTREFVTQYSGCNISSVDNFKINKPEKLKLNEFTAFVNIKGALRGIFIISIDEQPLLRIIKNFFLEKLDPNDVKVYLEDVLAECTNTILGNSVKLMPELENMSIINTPITISSKNALIKYPESNIWTCNMNTDIGSISISFVTSLSSNII